MLSPDTDSKNCHLHALEICDSVAQQTMKIFKAFYDFCKIINTISCNFAVANECEKVEQRHYKQITSQCDLGCGSESGESHTVYDRKQSISIVHNAMYGAQLYSKAIYATAV